MELIDDFCQESRECVCFWREMDEFGAVWLPRNLYGLSPLFALSPSISLLFLNLGLFLSFLVHYLKSMVISLYLKLYLLVVSLQEAESWSSQRKSSSPRAQSRVSSLIFFSKGDFTCLCLFFGIRKLCWKLRSSSVQDFRLNSGEVGWVAKHSLSKALVRNPKEMITGWRLEVSGCRSESGIFPRRWKSTLFRIGWSSSWQVGWYLILLGEGYSIGGTLLPSSIYVALVVSLSWLTCFFLEVPCGRVYL